MVIRAPSTDMKPRPFLRTTNLEVSFAASVESCALIKLQSGLPPRARRQQHLIAVSFPRLVACGMYDGVSQSRPTMVGIRYYVLDHSIGARTPG